MFKNVLLVVATASLAACGGGGGGGDTTPANPVTNPTTPTTPTTPSGLTTAASFQALVDSNAALDAAGSGNVTPRDTLRAAGAATYEGYINFFEDDPAEFAATDIAGELTLNIDFGGPGSPSGSVTNLTRRDGTTFTGDLNVTSISAFTNDDGGSLFADIIGRVTDEDGNLAEFDATLNETEAFGADAEQLRGGSTARYEYLGESINNDGSYVVQKQ